MSDENAVPQVRLRRDGSLVSANPPGAQLFGYRSPGAFEEGLRRGELALEVSTRGGVHGLVAGGQPQALEARCRRRDGTTFDGSLRLLSGPDPDGLVTVALFETTSGPRRSVDLAHLLGSLPVPVFVKDASHRWIVVNDSLCEFMGRPRDALVGKTDHDFFPAHEADLCWRMDNLVFETGETVENEETLDTPRGRRATLVRKSRYRDLEGAPLVIAVLTDISERKAMEEDLRRSRDELDRLVAERTAALEQANRQLRIDLGRRRQIEASLRESEERYRSLVELAPEAIAVHAEGQIRYLNPSGIRLFGGERLEQFVGRPVFDFVHPAYRELARTRIEEGYRMRMPQDWVEEKFLRLDGREMDVEIGVAPIVFRGAPAMLAVISDISERKRLERDLRDAVQRLESLLETSPLAVIEWTSDECRIVRWSNAAASVFGWTAQEMVGKRLDDLEFVYPEDRGLVDRALEDLRSGRRPREVTRNRNLRKDGQVIECEWYNSTLLDPSGKYSMLSIVVDVTERKRTEQALLEAHRRQTEFLGVLSHELRNPLSPIRNSLYILERAAPRSEQASRAQTVIARQVSHLARLVDDLLDVTRVTRGKIRLQRTRMDLVDLARRTLEDHRSDLERHAVEVDLPDEPVWVDGDPVRLAQVLGNLLQNSAKFTPAGGRISLSLTTSGRLAEMAVTDTGMGIDRETLDRLFVPFAQADRSLDRSRGGLGLGLALVKGLVELHGGRVHAHSAGPGQGARFSFEIPLAEHGPAQVEAPEPRPSRRGRRVLVIEDNRDAADSLREVLKLAGFEVAVAYDGESGLARAREEPPEIVICDVGLPAGMNGYAVARAFRQDRRVASAYLVALTGYAQPDDRRLAFQAGFDAHIAKPPDLAALERLLSEAPECGSNPGIPASP